MPTLTLKVAPAPQRDYHAALASALTDITARTLGKRPEVTAVVIEETPAAWWFVGGQQLRKQTALLEISITRGTNTDAQKAHFIEAAYAELQRQLAQDADFEPASYVIVREVDATDWGYGGQTQAARRSRVREKP